MKLIILDRDGVINQDRADFVKTPAEWQPIPGSLKAIAKLNRLGYKVVVASNQSGLGRGLFDIAALNAMHAKLTDLLKLEGGELSGIFFCPHHPDEDCDCRKPKPGLFTDILRRFDISDPQKVYAVGDSLRDLVASAQAGCQPVLVLTGNGEKTQQQGKLPSHTLTYTDLLSFAQELTRLQGT